MLLKDDHKEIYQTFYNSTLSIYVFAINEMECVTKQIQLLHKQSLDKDAFKMKTKLILFKYKGNPNQLNPDFKILYFGKQI